MKHKWRGLENGIIEVRHNKRRGVKLIARTSINNIVVNCPRCCLKCRPQIESSLCFKVDPSGYTFFQKV